MTNFNYDLNHLKLDEGFSVKMYVCTAGYSTIGYGYNLDIGMSEEEAELLLIHRAQKVDIALQRNLAFYKTAPPELQNILCNMAYQMGVSGLLKFKKSLAAMEAKDYEKAAEELLDSKWAKQTSLRAHRLADRVRAL